MKKIIGIYIILIFALSGWSTCSTTGLSNDIGNINSISDKIIVSEPIFKEDNNFVLVKIKESKSYYYQPGKPLLPVISKTYMFPLGTNIIDIDIDCEYEEFILSKKIQPTPKPIIISNELSQEINKIKTDKRVYNSLNFYPLKSYSISKGAGLQYEDHVLFLNIKIIPQYSPLLNLLLVPHEIEIKVEYQLPERPLFTADEYDMVIIAPSQFSSALQPLIDHKNSYSVRTFLKTVEEIYDRYEGQDEAEKIKYFIKDAIEIFNISIILLVGDINKIPIRNARMYIDSNFDYIPTDLYYADIYDYNTNFCDWNSNQNDIIGEFWGDKIDLYPDIIIGRIPCSNEDQLLTVIEKIITYESNLIDDSWFNRIILMGGDTFPNFGLNEGEIVTEIIAKHMSNFGFETIKLWTSKNTFKPRIINKEITNGAGFVSYSGHGYEQGFGTSPPDKTIRKQYYSPYILGMNNEFRLPIFFFDACSTARLDFTVEDLKEWYPSSLPLIFSLLYDIKYKSENLYPCFAWELLMKSNGGAIVSIGATRVAYANINGTNIISGACFLNKIFFESYSEELIIGEMFTNSISLYQNYIEREFDVVTPLEFILLGDPSLKIGGY